MSKFIINPPIIQNIIISLESAVVMEQLIQEKFYEVIFPHVSQFELGSGHYVEQTIKEKPEPSNRELSITESNRVLALDEKPTMPTSIDAQFTRLVIATMLAMTIL